MLIRKIVVISIVLIVFNFAQASALLNNNSISSTTSDVTALANSTLSSATQTTSTLSNTTQSTITPVVSSTVNNIVSSPITAINQLPEIIMAEKIDTEAINTAINSQFSILLNTLFPPLTDGQTIINAIGMPIYTLTNSTSDIAIIPTVVTTINSTSGQFVATPPLAKIIPGQEMIIPVADSLIPSFGGLKEIDVQSSPTATSTGGTAPEEWLTAEVDNKIPSSIPADDIDGTIILFLNIQYPYEQTGVGFNWGNPANHAKPPTLTMVVNKTSSLVIQNDDSGCPIIDAYTLSAGAWTDNGLGEISSASISPTQCQIKIQSQHLSKFALSMRHIGTIKKTGPDQFGIGTAVSILGNINLVQAASATTNNTITTTSNNSTASYSTIADPSTGFSNIQCGKGTSYALMIGQYTGGSIPYRTIFLKMMLLDSAGHVLTTGNGHISDIGAYETKSFNAIARYDKDFTSCQVQVDTSIPK
ncbi:MAG: hypothetical protein HY223_04215 [Thaumarchaeota archaeon]|nr:hypothetical protein [Nitrososphaerota archaeon]